MTSIILFAASLAKSPSPSKERTDKFLLYADAEQTEPIPKDGSTLFHGVMIGWNNKTIWLKNNETKPILIGYEVAVPEGCRLFWDHDPNSLIESGQTVKLNLFLFIPENLGASRFSIGFSLLAYVQTSAQEASQ